MANLVLMPFIETVSATIAYRDQCEDRVATFRSGERTVIVVSDGAGGTGSGDVAAECVVREIEGHYANVHSANEWAALLRQIDLRITDGEATVVVVDVRPYGIAGASVGDSQAWILRHDSVDILTQNQIRKPLLGSNAALPVGFHRPPLDGLLFVATDGFCNFAKHDAITRVVSSIDFYEIPRRCIEMVRLPSGELWDDVGIVAARITPRQRTRKRYSIP